MVLKSRHISRRQLIVDGAVWLGSIFGLLVCRWPWSTIDAAAEQTGSAIADHERLTIEAMIERIIPTDDTPGAIEAGCMDFIEKTILGRPGSDQARSIYRSGAAGLNAASRAQFNRKFVQLNQAQQDLIICGLETGTVPGWPASAPPPSEFFEMVRTDTIFGFLALPRYGGNRDYAGWRTVGYPGPRHHHGGYSEAQMQGKDPITPVWARQG